MSSAAVILYEDQRGPQKQFGLHDLVLACVADELGCDVFGISRDSIKSHEAFKKKMGFPFELLSDQDEKACSMFAVIKMKNMYGRQVRGIERSTFAVDSAGVVRGEWRAVKVPGHAQEVLDFIKSRVA